jgi:SPX domain protein involved in polyphosphate accumulation/uncharacterized membrane protein YidH (DUF202 family)
LQAFAKLLLVGQQLASSLIKDYYYHYISYDDLKAALKTPFDSAGSNKRRPWTEDDEKAFVELLEAELDKVFTFQRVKAGEIVRRIKSSEKEVHDVVQKQKDALSPALDGSHTEPPSEDDFMLLEEDLSDIIADVHDLAKFIQLNYTGFQKIIKKHDKQTGWFLKPVFAARLKAKPFFEQNYDAFIVKLSMLYDLVRTRGDPVKGDSAAGGSQRDFIRQTTKYWVHPDNITELKLVILKHLPVLVFNASKEFETKDSAISSIYYDNPETWELYTGRLKKTEGAEAIRLRWYGGMDVDSIFVERKTHREDWTGEDSVKTRFQIKEKNVNAFMRGEFTPAQVVEKLRKDGKKSKTEIDQLQQLAHEIQYRILDRKLVPVTRSFYNRTAFQLPGDSRVRISLDTELTMTREDNLDGKRRCGNNWRRMDIGIDWPFKQLPAQDVERFPYAVLEVKLATQEGKEPPLWVRELVSSHLVEAVPKFSKFIHGTATLFPTRINLLPFWMPQMDVDIRKPITQRFGIERPAQSASFTTSDDTFDDDSDADDDDDDEEEDDAETAHTHTSATLQNGNGHNSGTEVNTEEELRRLRATRDAMEAHDRDRTTDFPQTPGPNELDAEERVAQQPLTNDEYLYDSDDEDLSSDRLEEAKRIGGWHYHSFLLKHHFRLLTSSIFTALSHRAKPTPLSDSITAMAPLPAAPLAKRFKAPKGKRIHVPVRVEPKVYFAAERTFLSWLEFSIILGSIAAALLNLAPDTDPVSLYSAWAFTIVACAALGYSMGLYLWRVRAIRERRAVRYHDKWGPSVLCAGLVAAVAVNFALRWRNGITDGGLRG